MRRAASIVLCALSLVAGATTPATPQEGDRPILYSGYRYAGRGAGSGIFTIVPGSEPVRLVSSRRFNLEPVWSPDGTRVAYVHHDQPRNPDIWLMDADGSNKVRLTTGRADDVYPQWSPDGSHIAWVKIARGGSRGRIYVMHPDGADKVAVSPQRHSAVTPVWSPDGHSIAYVHFPTCTDCSDDGDIFVVNGHSPGPATRITDNDVHDVTPAWSPDGSRIAFTRDHGDGSNVFTVATDGSDERELTSLEGYAFLPQWSPDGSEIAFTVIVNTEDFHTRLGLVEVATAEDRFLTELEAGGIQPRWSPDGSRIAFIGFHSGGHNLGVIDRDGTGLTQLTDSALDEAWVDW